MRVQAALVKNGIPYEAVRGMTGPEATGWLEIFLPRQGRRNDEPRTLISLRQQRKRTKSHGVKS